MADTYTLESQKYQGRYMYLTCKQNKNIPENKSSIDWMLTVAGGTSPCYTTGPTTVQINGQTVYYKGETSYSTEKFPAAKGSVKGTLDVTHNTDGSMSIAVSIKTAIYTARLETKSGTWVLDNIPRESTPTLSANSVQMGNTLTIYTNCASDLFTHTLTYAFGEQSGTIAQNITTSYPWEVPYDLAKAIRNDPSGEGTITCTTYNGEELIGSKSVGFTAIVPDNDTTKPQASMQLSTVHNLGENFSGIYIQGKSSVRAEFTATSEYSTISHYGISGYGLTGGAGNPAEASLAYSGSITVTGRVTDARGYYREQSQTITVLPYRNPTVVPYGGESGVVCRRCDSGGGIASSGIYLKIKAQRSYERLVSDGAQKNHCSLEYRSKLTSGGSWGAWTTLLDKNDTSTDSVDKTIGDVVSDATLSYTIQIRAVDDVGTPHVLEFSIPTDSVTFHLKEGGKGAAFFKYAEKDGALEIGGDLWIKNENMVSFICDEGVKDGWQYRKWNSGLLECWTTAMLMPIWTPVNTETVNLPFTMNSSDYSVQLTGVQNCGDTCAIEFAAVTGEKTDGRTPTSVAISYMYIGEEMAPVGVCIHIIGYAT